MKLFSRASFLISALATLLGLTFPQAAQAQFLGYTSPQSVQQTLATNLQCTGAAQNFNVANLGQNQHFVTITGAGNTFLNAQIQGIDSQGNPTRISDILEVPSTTPAGALSGSGYYPIVRVVVTCSSNVGSTFTLSYSGTSGAPAQSVGGYQTAQIDKLSFIGQAANANATDAYQTPFGSLLGEIYFAYNVNPGIVSTLTITCSGNGLTLSTYTFTLPTTNTLQSFSPPARSCPRISLTYTSGGATAAIFSLETVFFNPGTLPPGSIQPTQTFNQQLVGGANTAISISITGVGGQRAHLYSASARCSAGTAQLTVTDNAVQIWTTAATEVGATTFRYQWNPGLAGSPTGTMNIGLSTCGVGNTGTLNVQASQF